MKSFITILTLIFNIFFLQHQIVKAQCHIDDWIALKALYENTDGDNWRLNGGWEILDTLTMDCNLTNLEGIGLDTSGRVDSINLPGNRLNGSIPFAIGGLSNLRILNLSGSDLTNISPGIGNLNNLINLNLSNNELNAIPAEVGNLSSLKYLNLSSNIISYIPNQLGNLSNLLELNLRLNQLSDTILIQLGNLNNLQQLNLRDNILSGNIPSQLGNLSNLIVLNLRGNLLSGSIPIQLGNLNNLEQLNLTYNELSGSIPSALGNLSNLENLSLYENQLSGGIPPALGNLSNLTYLSLYGNQLSGSIPAELGNLSNLISLDLKRNQISGSIPEELGYLNNLMALDLSNNQLSGVIPYQIGNLSNLIQFFLFNNLLSGCYHNNLAIHCSYYTQIFISEGNNFDVPWQNFCSTGAGVCSCPPDCPIELSDVYPGDLNHDGIVNRVDVGLVGLYKFEVGAARTTEHQNIDWYDHPAQDWGRTHLNGEDIKHFDCNGDGAITDNDEQAVLDNMDRTWTNPSPPPVAPAQTDYQVMLQPVDQVIDGFLLMDVALERRSGGNLNLQGGHFTIDYSDVEGVISQATLNLDPTPWIGIPNINLWYESKAFPAEKKIEVGFSRSDNVISEGSGVIGRLILAYDNSASRQAGKINEFYEFKVNTIGTQDGATYTLIEDQILQVDLSSGTCQPNLIITENTPFLNTYKSSNTIETNGFILIGDNQQVEYKANNRVTLNSGFRLKKGAEFNASSSSCQ